MARPLKIVLAVIGGLLGLIIIVAGVAIATFDPNDYRDVIETSVEDATGRQLTMNGDLSLSLFPWLGVEANDVMLANAEGFGPEPFAQVGQFGVGVKLLPLLSKEIQIGTVRLNGMRLNLTRQADGTTNWDDLTATQEGEPPPPPETTTTGNGFQLSSLAVEAVEISDAAIRWTDATGGQDIQLKNFQLSTGRIAPSTTEPIPLSTAFEVSIAEPATQLTVDLVSELVADLNGRYFALNGLKIDGMASGDAVPAGKQAFALGTDLTFDQGAGLLKLIDLTVQAAGISLTGQVDGAGLDGDAPNFNGQIVAQAFNPQTVMRNLGLTPPQTRDTSALSNAAADLRFTATPTAATIEQLQATLDDTTLTGQASVTDFANPATVFNLAIDQLDLDRYLPPPAEDDGAEQTDDEAPTGDINAIEIPVEPLQGLDIDGTATMAKFTASGVEMTDAKLVLRGKPGQPLEQTLTANMYSGDVQMTNRITPGDSEPSYRFRGNLDKVLFGELLADLMDKTWLAGQGLFNYDLTTSGKTVGDMRRNLSGTVGFGVADGAIKGIDLARVLAAAEQRLRGATAEVEPGGETKFQRFDGAMTVNKGVARLNDFQASSDWANVSATGAINLVDLTLDYTLRPVLSRAPEGAGTLSALIGKTIPVTVTGPVTSPKIGIDIQSLLKAEAQQQLDKGKAELRGKAEAERARIDEKVEKEKERAREKVRDKLGDFLNRGTSNQPTEESGDQASGDDAGGG